MKNNEKMTDEGMIEAFCLGTLSENLAKVISDESEKNPAVRVEIDRTIAALAQYAPSTGPAPDLKGRVLAFLENHLAPETIDLKNPPIIHRLSDAFAWERAVAGLEPTIADGNFKVFPIEETAQKELCLVWLHAEMIEDAHVADDFTESFLILEGACECDFGGEIVRFSAGDYFEIPANTRHSIKNISVGLPFVKGLVQRRRAA